MAAKKLKQKVSIHSQVMQRIQREKIVMRPRWHFIVGSVLLGVGMAGTLLVTAFFVHVLLFNLLAQRGPLMPLLQGRLGLVVFLRLFPWLPFLMAIGGLWGGSILLKKFDVSYKKSFVGLVIAFVAMVFALGFLLERMGVGQKAMRVRHLRRLYQQQEMLPLPRPPLFVPQLLHR